MGRLSTHVLDIARGKPAGGVIVELYRIDGAGTRTAITTTRTNQDGRTDEPLLQGADFKAGTYELVFHIGDYFRGIDPAVEDFLDVVPLRVRLSDSDGHYHVPLVCAPFGYSTYRGS